MWISKLKTAMAVVVVLAAVLGAGGLVCRGTAEPAARGADNAPPPSELEALRKENALLKVNLMLVLEKVRAQGDEITALKAGRANANLDMYVEELNLSGARLAVVALDKKPDPLAEAAEALKALRAAKDEKERAKATDALEAALKKLRETSLPAATNRPEALKP